MGIIGDGAPCGYESSGRPYSAAEALTPDGSVDTAFGSAGTTYFSIPGAGYDLSAVSLPDGDTILASYGDETACVSVQDFAADGLPILAFGHRDQVRIGFSETTTDWAVPPGMLVGPRDDVVFVIPSNHEVTMEERIG